MLLILSFPIQFILCAGAFSGLNSFFRNGVFPYNPCQDFFRDSENYIPKSTYKGGNNAELIESES